MRINVHITPNASRNEIAGSTENGVYKVKIQSPPVDGAANKHLIKFIAGKIGISKSKIRIVHGIKSRNKILEIDGDETMIRQKWEQFDERN